MGRIEKRKARGRPTKVNRERLTNAVREVGFTGLKLEDVAERLGITIQTLYNHVRDRNELLQIAADTVIDESAFPEDDDVDWPDWWRKVAPLLMVQCRKYPGLAAILASRSPSSVPPLHAHWETAQRIAEKYGFGPLEALWANMALHEFVISWAARMDIVSDEIDRNVLDGRLRTSIEGDMSHFTESVTMAMNSHSGERFSFQLEAMIVGLSSRRNTVKARLMNKRKVSAV